MDDIIESIFVKTYSAKENLPIPNPAHMVMLHGWGQSHLFFHSLALSYQEENNYTVILIDLPGFGKSKAPTMENDSIIWDSSDYANGIIKLLEKKGIKNCILWGHSFGGKISLHLAHKRPDLVDTLVIMGSSGLPRTRTWKEKARFKAIGTLGKCLKLIDKSTPFEPWANWFSPKFASYDYKNSKGIMRKILVKTIHENVTDMIQEIKLRRIFIVWGNEDTETPVEVAYRFHKLLKNSQLIIIPHRGHLILQNLSYQLIKHLVQL